MAVQVDKDICEGCGECSEVCPQDAIKVVDGVAEVDSEECEECGACVEVCPNNALSLGRRSRGGGRR
jgi:electron transfer flavoprotein alpha subunit